MTNSIVHLLHRAHQVATKRFGDTCTLGAVTARQVQILLAIAALHEPSQSDIVDATGIDRSTMADVVRRLCKSGLAARVKCRRDARRYKLRLTDKGQAETERFAAEAAAVDDAVLGLVPAKLRSGFRAALESLAAGAPVGATAAAPANLEAAE